MSIFQAVHGGQAETCCLQERDQVEKQRVQAELLRMRLDGTDVSSRPMPPGLAAAAAAAAGPESDQ